jgi:alkylated DNA repair dioxygenase AlkB
MLTENSYLQVDMLPRELQIGPPGTREFEELWNLHPEKRKTITVFSKKVTVPRWCQTYGQIDYCFSNQKFEALPVPNILQPYLDWANQKDQKDERFNTLHVNWYDDGNDYIGWHSDNEKNIVKGSDIYTVSFGAERRFKIRSKDKTVDMEVPTTHNGYIVMGGSFQDELKHHIPRSKKVKDRRISITIRKFHMK